MGGVVDPVLLFLDLDFGGTTDADHRDTTSQLREPLLQFLAVVIRRRLLDLLANGRRWSRLLRSSIKSAAAE